MEGNHGVRGQMGSPRLELSEGGCFVVGGVDEQETHLFDVSRILFTISLKPLNTVPYRLIDKRCVSVALGVMHEVDRDHTARRAYQRQGDRRPSRPGTELDGEVAIPGCLQQRDKLTRLCSTAERERVV